MYRLAPPVVQVARASRVSAGNKKVAGDVRLFEPVAQPLPAVQSSGPVPDSCKKPILTHPEMFAFTGTST